MPTVQIKHVPEDVHRVLRRRAAEAGQSMQEHVLGLLVDYAGKPTVAEIFARIDRETGSGITMEDAVKWIREERDAR